MPLTLKIKEQSGFEINLFFYVHGKAIFIFPTFIVEPFKVYYYYSSGLKANSKQTSFMGAGTDSRA